MTGPCTLIFLTRHASLPFRRRLGRVVLDEGWMRVESSHCEWSTMTTPGSPYTRGVWGISVGWKETVWRLLVGETVRGAKSGYLSSSRSDSFVFLRPFLVCLRSLLSGLIPEYHRLNWLRYIVGNLRIYEFCHYWVLFSIVFNLQWSRTK